MAGYLYLLMTDKIGGFLPFIFKQALYILSLLYLLCVRAVFWLYKSGILPSFKPKARVISVGNLTLGGTGKTPLVEFIAGYLSQRAKKVAILTRGYGIAAKKGSSRPGSDDKPFLFEEIGDESALLADKLPQVTLLVGADRAKNAKIAVNDYGIDTLVLDDGFQSWELERDLDIVTVDVLNPFGNGKLLPRGILREPLAQLGRADVVVLTRTDIASPAQIEAVKGRIRSYNSNILIVSSFYKPTGLEDFSAAGKENTLDVNYIKPKECIVVCGIASPDYFIETLKRLGAAVKEEFIFQDHHPYNKDDLNRIAAKCRQLSIETIITTQKDAVKLRPLVEKLFLSAGLKLQFLALVIQVELTQNREKFIDYILHEA